MQPTAAQPRDLSTLYTEFAQDAAVVERHGLDSVWTAEHRATDDGWCPAPLHALAFVAARTERVRLGTAMLLAPQHDPVALASAAETLDELSGGRLELGVGLGYRPEEFALLGTSRRRRGARMEVALDHLDPRRVWIGGMAPAALARAARRKLPLLLPQTLPVAKLRTIAAAHPAPVGVLRDVHITDDAEPIRAALRAHYRKEIEAWWGDTDTARQLDFIDRAALVGDAASVAAGLDELYAAGASLVVARLQFPFIPRTVLHDQIARLAG
jgi:alkanesulfonate monooxygenase SsuD/methylene tetrahydromethanopterin reductase-like flavin-dependent oxidoreductase (luciferase family)